jgi:hypothetical protein
VDGKAGLLHPALPVRTRRSLAAFQVGAPV